MIATIGAVLWLTATAGFWPGGHWQGIGYHDLAACEHGRPGVEARARADGCTGVTTTCREVRRADT